MANDVLVYCGEGEGVRQPDDFRCCPLGLQFYTERELPSYELMDLSLQLPGSGGETSSLNCTGVVVYSQLEPQSGMHRVWVAFLDVPESVRTNLRCLAEDSSFLCPHCENF